MQLKWKSKWKGRLEPGGDGQWGLPGKEGSERGRGTSWDDTRADCTRGGETRTEARRGEQCQIKDNFGNRLIPEF